MAACFSLLFRWIKSLTERLRVANMFLGSAPICIRHTICFYVHFEFVPQKKEKKRKLWENTRKLRTFFKTFIKRNDCKMGCPMWYPTRKLVRIVCQNSKLLRILTCFQTWVSGWRLFTWQQCSLKPHFSKWKVLRSCAGRKKRRGRSSFYSGLNGQSELIHVNWPHWLALDHVWLGPWNVFITDSSENSFGMFLEMHCKTFARGHI